MILLFDADAMLPLALSARYAREGMMSVCAFTPFDAAARHTRVDGMSDDMRAYRCAICCALLQSAAKCYDTRDVAVVISSVDRGDVAAPAKMSCRLRLLCRAQIAQRDAATRCYNMRYARC